MRPPGWKVGSIKKARELPSIEILRDWFEYDPNTGTLICKRHNPVGRKKSYLRVRCDGKRYPVHRIIWKMVTGNDPGSLGIDHINGIRNDNRFSNLRLANQSQQIYNSKIRSDNKFGFKGVRITRSGKYGATIKDLNGKRIYLGRFDTAELAAQAYIEAEEKMRGEFFNRRNIKRLE